MLIGCFAAMACALPGNFLLLRRQSLIGDAISHTVLPGIVVAFLITGTLGAIPMMIGAAGAALCAVLLIEAIRRIGRIEPGAAMGVVFTTMFACGVLLLEQTNTASVHLDVEHALYGNLESLIWLDGLTPGAWHDPDALATLPPELPRMIATFATLALLLALVWRPLTIATFDEPFAHSVGLPVATISLGLVICAALAAVAAFDAIGSIIVIAMFICPPATARLMTNSLFAQVLWSQACAALSAILGYLLAGYGPLLFGGTSAVSAAGMIATVAGLLLSLAATTAPHRKH
ncbi:metal ABC transporter permease [Sagittula sp. SSi028]|uniref:metal ABC transporter permease n=1 Tax=Sagittula sp. SSi028 TaxID=3400636 RepID=UPI003AF68732